MKAVVDTNVLVSGLLWHGSPSRVIDAVLDNRIELCLTKELLAELRAVLRRPRLARQVAERGLDPDWSCNFLGERALMLSPAGGIEAPDLRDRNDLPVLAAALAAPADLIITGDEDLLTLKAFAGIPIVDTTAALERLGLST